MQKRGGGRQEKRVALLTEGVDRNHLQAVQMCRQLLSPSSRRAWIEISKLLRCAEYVVVALLTEGVDRNMGEADETPWMPGRPPHGGRG